MTAVQVLPTPLTSSVVPPAADPASAPAPHPLAGRAPPALGTSLRALLDEMVAVNASDLHIVAGEYPKLRIDGEMTSASTGYVLGTKDTIQLAYSVLTEPQKKRFEQDDELDFSFGIANLARFRGNCFRQRGCVTRPRTSSPDVTENAAIKVTLPPNQRSRNSVQAEGG